MFGVRLHTLQFGPSGSVRTPRASRIPPLVEVTGYSAPEDQLLLELKLRFSQNFQRIPPTIPADRAPSFAVQSCPNLFTQETAPSVFEPISDSSVDLLL